MGFLKRFFRNVFREGVPSEGVPDLTSSSFEHLSEEALESHLKVAKYGNFELTEAVRPSFDLKVVPCQGFRHDVYRDEENQTNVPVLMGAVSKECLFETFMDLLDPLGSEVDVVLETSHDSSGRQHQDLYREHIDMPVLKSMLWDHEDMLLNDGCTGIAVLNPARPIEIQFDEHKLLIVYGDDLGDFEAIFRSREVHHEESMKFITEAEHVHSSREEYCGEFETLKTRLGMDSHI